MSGEFVIPMSKDDLIDHLARRPPARRPCRGPRAGGRRIIVSMDPTDTGAKPEPRLEPQAHGGALMRSAGPGRPKGSSYADVQSYIRSHLFADQSQDRIGIIDVLMQQARRGNIRAIELSLWYGIGKPTETIDLTVKVREAATRLAEQMGIDDSRIQQEADALLGR